MKGHIHSAFRKDAGQICLHANLPFGTERAPPNSHQQLSISTASSARRSVTRLDLQLLRSSPAANGHQAKVLLLATDYKINLNKQKIKAIKPSCWTNRRDEIKARTRLWGMQLWRGRRVTVLRGFWCGKVPQPCLSFPLAKKNLLQTQAHSAHRARLPTPGPLRWLQLPGRCCSWQTRGIPRTPSRRLPCVQLSWEAPPQKHSVQVCVTSVEQCRNVLTSLGRWLLSGTMALVFTLACSWKGTRRRSTNTCLQIDTLLRAFCLYIVIQYKASFVLRTRKELADPLTFSSLYAINHGSIILSSNVSNERGYQRQVGFLR